MLSNTAETNPSTSVVSGAAGGSLSTGIIDAHTTSDSRNTAPFAAAGTTFQSGRRHGVSNRMMPMTVAPMYGIAPALSAGKVFEYTLAAMAPMRMSNTMTTRDQSRGTCALASFKIGE